MVIVLLVVALLGGSAIGLMIISDDERALNRASVEVEVLAKRARTVAALQQRPYALEFFENRVALMPLAEAMLEPADREKALAAQAEAAEAAAEAAEANPDQAGRTFSIVHAGWELDGDMRMFVRRWATDAWIPINNESRQVWRFDPEGFCEPIGVRIEKDRSWKESEFHPLTGGIRDSSMEAY